MKHDAIYAGTFDPMTYGHLDVIERASLIFDRLIVAIAISTPKTPLFSAEERAAMTRDVVEDMDNVEVDIFDGLLVDYARAKGIHVLVRGLRAFSDFEFEFQMALTNRKLAPDMETLFLMPKEDYSYFGSNTVREVAELGGRIDCFVPSPVRAALQEKISKGSLEST